MSPLARLRAARVAQGETVPKPTAATKVIPLWNSSSKMTFLFPRITYVHTTSCINLSKSGSGSLSPSLSFLINSYDAISYQIPSFYLVFYPSLVYLSILVNFSFIFVGSIFSLVLMDYILLLFFETKKKLLCPSFS